MPYTEWGPSGKVSKESCGEATEAEDEAEEPTALQFYSGTIRVGLCPKEELREIAAAGPASSQSSVPDSPQGGHWDCPSPSSLEAVPRSSVTDVLCLDVCEERSSSAGSAQPSLVASSPPGLQPTESPPPEEDDCSDDSDDIIFSPFLPRKKSPSPF